MEEAIGGIGGHTCLPGTASLVQDIDKQLLIVLRDGRTLIGFLRSVDQFANLLMQHTVERIHVGKQFGDIPRGIYLIRGENVALCGEIDPALDGTHGLEKVSIDEILEAQRVAQEKEQAERKKREQLLRARGMRPLDSEFDS